MTKMTKQQPKKVLYGLQNALIVLSDLIFALALWGESLLLFLFHRWGKRPNSVRIWGNIWTFIFQIPKVQSSIYHVTCILHPQWTLPSPKVFRHTREMDDPKLRILYRWEGIRSGVLLGLSPFKMPWFYEFMSIGPSLSSHITRSVQSVEWCMVVILMLITELLNTVKV